MADRVIVLSKRPGRVCFMADIPIGGTPLSRRNHPDFGKYFNLIWKELDKHG
jgi:NitT/TauT family transport system ATP-binding protein